MEYLLDPESNEEESLTHDIPPEINLAEMQETDSLSQEPNKNSGAAEQISSYAVDHMQV